MVRELLKNLNQKSILALPILFILVLGMVGCVFDNNRQSQEQLIISEANQLLLKSTSNLDRYLENILEINEENLANYVFNFDTIEYGINRAKYFDNTYNFFEDNKLLLEEVETFNDKALRLYEETLQKKLDNNQKEYVLMKISVINKYNEVVSLSKTLIEKQETFKKYIEKSIRQSMTTCTSCGGWPNSTTKVGWRTILPTEWMNENIFSLKAQIANKISEAKSINEKADNIWSKLNPT